jgi:hypothetical protein
MWEKSGDASALGRSGSDLKKLTRTDLLSILPLPHAPSSVPFALRPLRFALCPLPVLSRETRWEGVAD